MAEPHNTLKQASPLFFPKFSAAFKPFKKRARSFHNGPEPGIQMNGSNSSPDVMKRRDEKAERKEQDEQEANN